MMIDLSLNPDGPRKWKGVNRVRHQVQEKLGGKWASRGSLSNFWCFCELPDRASIGYTFKGSYMLITHDVGCCLTRA